MPTPGFTVTRVFLLALNSSDMIPEFLAEEADIYKDMVFLPTLDKYSELVRASAR